MCRSRSLCSIRKAHRSPLRRAFLSDGYMGVLSVLYHIFYFCLLHRFFEFVSGFYDFSLHQSEKHQAHAVNNSGHCSVYYDRTRYNEHFGRKTGYKSLCLCQDKDTRKFCPILLVFCSLRFLKKAVFFASLLL